MFDKYMRRVLGRLSVPKMQCSIKLRLRMVKDEPLQRERETSHFDDGSDEM